MNWDAIGAIGEVLGAVAVLITLIYFAIQLKKTQVSVETLSSQTSQQGVLDLQRIDLEFADLIVRANNGESLSETEQYRLNSIAGARISVAHNFYIRANLLGQDTSLAVDGFATYLHLNPSMQTYWREFPGYTISQDWISKVNASLATMRSDT